MSKSASLRVEDVRALLRLVGECRDLGDDTMAWREHFCRRLADLTGAGLGMIGEVVDVAGQLRPLQLGAWGWENGFDPSVIGRVEPKYGHDLKFSSIYRAYFDRPRRDFGICLSRTDVVPDREWDRSTYRDVIHSPLGCGHHPLCVLPVAGAGGEVCTISCVRPRAERRDFTARDRVLVQEAHAAVVPLVGGPLAGYADPSPADLSPRARQMLRCLLEGDRDKQAAVRLGVSRFTVNQYTKEIYRHFRVQGRAELLALWVRRGRRPRFAWDTPVD